MKNYEINFLKCYWYLYFGSQGLIARKGGGGSRLYVYLCASSVVNFTSIKTELSRQLTPNFEL